MNEEENRVQVSLLGPHLLKELRASQKKDPESHESMWSPEYASYMIESEGVRERGIKGLGRSNVRWGCRDSVSQRCTVTQ